MKVAEEVKPVVNEVKKGRSHCDSCYFGTETGEEEPKPVVVEKPVETEKKVVEEVKKEEPKCRGVSRKKQRRKKRNR